MTASTSSLRSLFPSTVHALSAVTHLVVVATRPIRAALKAAVCVLKVYPMLPSGPVDWVTAQPVVDKVTYPTRRGMVEGQMYRPWTGGPHPAKILSLGVVPFGVEHPQIPIMGKALARAGFVALI